MAIFRIKDPDRRDDPERPVLYHLVALRESLVFALVSWGLCAIAAGAFSPAILEILKSPAAANEEMLQGLDLTSGFSAMMSIAIWGGTALSFPFLVFAILRFVFPALSKREKIAILALLTAATALFIVGAALAYRETVPLVVEAFQDFNRWVGLPVQTIRIEGYISIVLKIIVAFGLVFQLPLILFILGCFGLVTSAWLRKERKIAIVLSFIIAMVLTPPDPVSQVALAVPLCILYEISIWALWLKERVR